MKKQIYDIYNRVKDSDIGYRVATGAFWSFTGTALAKFIVLISSIICARILTQQEFGEFGLVRSTINMFVVVGAAGLGVTATKYISEYKKANLERVPSIYILTNGFAWITGIIVAFCVFISAKAISVNLLNTPLLETSIKVGSLLLFVTILNGAQSGTLSGFEDFKSIAINTFIGSIFESIFMLIGAYYYGVNGAVLGFGSGYIVLYICNLFSIKRHLRNFGIDIRFSLFNKKDLKLLYSYSLPAMLSSLVVAPTFWGIRTILAKDSGFAELALYEAADQWKIIILFIPSAISQIVLPILSSSGNSKNFWKILKINILINGLVSFVLTSGIALFSPFIMKMYGDSYIGGEWTLILLAISTIFSSVSNVVGLSIYSRAKMWVGFLFNTIWAVLTLGFTYLFVSLNFGAMGVALAITLAYLLHTIYQYVYLYLIFRNHE